LSGLANPLPSDWGFFAAPASPAFQSLFHHTLFYVEITRKATKFLCPQSYITHALSTPSISRASQTPLSGTNFCEQKASSCLPAGSYTRTHQYWSGTKAKRQTLVWTKGVSHCGLAIYIKTLSEGKEEELWKLKYFTMQKYNLKPIL
jgi:hypothetical protein